MRKNEEVGMGALLGGIAGMLLMGSLAVGVVAKNEVRKAREGFHQVGEKWKFAGDAKLDGWQVHVTVNGKRVVCENPTVWDTEVISCEDIVQIDEGEGAEEPPAPPARKTAEAVSVPFDVAFRVDVSDIEQRYRDGIREINEGLEGPKLK